ncbi:MAG: xanthine/uracil/vitamin C permease [Desulfobulbaceae bacterium S3730MH12]|nr:MAG: xanthine/uracil/vitamin C permease [Desulfobulbaceae bacterium S5133MH15]OEU55523.1 MAG: xanthine/uracil/vitamin C permease [Desulfobulbaceae bacterium S3730MH12]OEU80842.1 MAG: xanthine/uracil/vitamin C permease [Desulfobulbaceae bacterium C00003063]
MSKTFHYPLFSRNDLSAFWALFTDNLTNLIVLSGICKFVFHMPDEIVFGRIVPGAAVAILLGVCVYTYLAQRLAKKEQRSDVTALPYGISTPVMFVYLFGVIGPIYWATNDAELAWQIGIGAGFIGGIVAALGALIGPFLKRVTPRAGMLGTLCGIALVFIGVVPLTMVFEDPIIGFVSLTIVMWGLVGRFKLPFNLPAGLLALVAGTVIALILGKASINFDGIGFYPPIPYFGDMIVGIQYLFAHPELFLVLIPVQIYNFIETMNNVESAEAVGDKYPVSIAMLTDGFGTMLGAVCGSPFPTTVYIGHPGYKRINARCGYVLAVGVVFFLAACFGFLAFLSNLVPLAATAPILVYVAIIIISETARTCPSRHGMAIAIAMMPHVSAFLMIKWSGMLNALGSLGVENIPSISDPELIAALGQQGAHVVGHQILSQGAIITGLMWGAFLAHLIDAKFKEASGFMLVSAAMASLGIIHSASLHWPSFNGIVGGYLFVGLGILFYSMSTEVERLPDSGDSSETLEVEFSD